MMNFLFPTGCNNQSYEFFKHFQSVIYRVPYIWKWSTFHPAREASPVGEHHERQIFTVEVTNRLSGFKGRIREPHLASLLQNLIQEHKRE